MGFAQLMIQGADVWLERTFEDLDGTLGRVKIEIYDIKL
jgi:hypothetical protein